MWFAWAVVDSLAESIYVPRFHLDGAFQTASSLYRLDAGQYPGKDFYPYLGVMPLYLLFPAFKILGSDLCSSVFSAYFLTRLVRMLAIAFIWQMIWKPKTFLTATAAGSLLFFLNLLAVLIYNNFQPQISLLPNNIAPLPTQSMIMESISLSPGNSLRPVRSFAPYLGAMIFYFIIIPIKSIRVKVLSAGFLSGVVLLWSNDYAISTTFFFAVSFSLYLILVARLSTRSIILYLASFGTAYCSLLYTTTHGHPLNLLQYNFINVAQDQWWYFGPYNDNSRIYYFWQFIELIFRNWNYPALSIILITVLFAVKERSKHFLLLAWVGLALFFGGIVACVGGHYDAAYFHPLYYWAMVTTIVASFRFLGSWLNLNSHFNNKLILAISGLVICCPFTIALYQYRHEYLAAKDNNEIFFVPELGGYLPINWRDYIELARNTPANKLVAEEYWGIFSAVRKTFFTWPVDSVIHALGEVRNEARQQLEQADLIISTRHSISKDWQPWNLSQNYWFYQNLLSDWAIADVSPTTVVWKKKPDFNTPIAVYKNAPCVPFYSLKGAGELSVEVPMKGYYEINMQYRVTIPGRNFIHKGFAMIQNNISFPAGAYGYLAIDPKASEVIFPAFFDRIGESRLNLKITGNKKTTIQIFSCTAKKIAFDNELVLPSIPYIPKLL
jgi:hypothetical protein